MNAQAVLVVCGILLVFGCASTSATCKPEDATAITARYSLEVATQCAGVPFDECPAVPEIEAARQARLEKACPTR